MTLYDIEALYARAASCEISDDVVEHAGARAFVSVATGFLRLLGESQDSPLWRNASSVIRRTRWLVCSIPLPFNAPLLALAEIAQALRGAVTTASGIGESRFVDLLAEVAAKLEDLSLDTANPLGECARSFIELDRTGPAIIVIPDRRFVSGVANEIQAWNPHDEPGTPAVRVGVYSELGRGDAFLSAAIIGSPARLPPALLNAPRADYISLIHYGFFREAAQVTYLLEYGQSNHVVRPIKHGKPLVVASLEPAALLSESDSAGCPINLTNREFGPDDIDQLVAQVRIDHQFGSGEKVDARAAVLAGGSYTFLPIDGEAGVTLVEPEAIDGSRIEYIRATSIEPGDFIAIRAESNYVELIRRADAILGTEASKLRERQLSWKQALRAKVRACNEGINGVEAELRERGAITTNVSYWMSTSCIRTRRKEDFRVVMAYLDRADEADELWKDLGRIDSAHRKAGWTTALQLESDLKPSHIEHLDSHGWCEVERLGGFGTTLIARVEKFLDVTIEVGVSMLCQLRRVEAY